MIAELQTRVQALLAADSYFDGVDIYTELKGDILWQVQQRLATLSFAVTIATASGRSADPRAQRVSIAETLLVSIIENPKLNLTGKTALAGLDAAIRILHCASVGQQLNDKFIVLAHESGAIEVSEQHYLNIQQLEIQTTLIFPRN
jgi:hypothetical protein